MGLRAKNGKLKYGGRFSDELDAAKRVNQICKGLGIPERNPGIGTMPHQQLKRKEKTSQYKGVSWYEREEKWYAKVQLKGKLKFGGSFIDELDAANSVNQLCKKLGIPEKNPGIGTIPPRQWQNFDIQAVGSEGANSVMDSEIIKTKNREKIKNSLKNFIIDDKSSFKKCYFYKYFLK